MATIATGGAPPESVDLTAPVAIVVGSEAHGLPIEVIERCESTVTIPLSASVESVNAAIAGAVQIQELSLSDLDLPEARAPLLQAFAHLKSLTLIRYGKGYPEETQAKIKTLLPTVAVMFVK